ncbi:lipopolysaccharide biosynthesis protein [Negativibacillus massiliensis]|uniref:lipopolysaccharide biosynthesis protein n=1 Tax=Negativibacillus massiliensis TaxID=1871035 RepID=UPI003AF28247
MTIFNQQSRTANMVRIAIVAEICTIANLIFGFVYRSIFLSVLSTQYLGINGLFVQILQVLSLADLGIAGAITFRFYKPIKENNIEQVGRLMNFFKFVYRIICTVILGVGIALLPFIQLLIKDTSEIPKDISLHFIYILFLLQSASSYMFAYKQTLLTVDQRQYAVSLFQMISTFARHCVQTIFLLTTHNYTMTLVSSIALQILSNFLMSIYVTRRYASVFEVKSKLSQEEKKEILRDTRACMVHKIGGIVLNSTDNLIVSKFVGIISVGLYSNYALIINNLTTLATQILSNTTASLGNMCTSLNSKERYVVYKNLIFVNLWVTSTLTICLYTLISPFIVIWVGQDMLLSRITVICLGLKFYMTLTRQVNMAYITASGLFVKDIYRPFIEASINLIVSIYYVNKLGIAGVFLGTIISALCTVIWREPYLIFKHNLKVKPYRYIFMQISFLAATVFMCLIAEHYLTSYITGFVSWGISAVLILIVTELFLILCFGSTQEFQYLKELALKAVKKMVDKLERNKV